MLPWLILAIIVLTLVGTGLYYWQTRVNVSQLFFTALPSYEIPDVILVGGTMVENRGRQPAPNVKITIQFEGTDAPMIHHMKVVSTENAVIRSGGERHTFANISARSVRPHGKIFVYWAASRDVQPKISVTSYKPATDSILQKVLPRKADA